MAIGSADEMRVWARYALDLGYLDGPDFASFWEADIKRVEQAVRAIGRVQG